MSRLIASSDVTYALGYTPSNQTALANYVLASSLAAVATSGNYADLIGRPSPYTLAPATAALIGGVKPGTGLTIATDGTLSVTGGGGTSGTAYVLPVASASQLGGVKQGVNVTIAADGTISATAAAAAAYSLPIGTATVLGGHKVGTGLAVATDGTLSTTGTGGTTYTLPIGSSTVLGGFKVGTGLTVATDGTLSATATGGTAYTLPIGSATVLGGYKVGAGLAVATDGTLSATGTASVSPATVAPLPNGTAAVGVSLLYARQDHVHPTGTSTYVLPVGSATALGGFKVGTGLAVATDGTLSTTGTGGTAYTLPIASATALGGIKVGANLSVATDGTLSAVATQARNPPRVITAAGNVTVAAADFYIGLNKTTAAATTVTFEAAPVAGSQHVVKDIKGDADANPITVVAGVTGGTIDGQASFIHNYPGAAFTFLYNGVEWSII